MSQVEDIYGKVDLPQDVLWGVNTQRSLQNFPIGEEKMPIVFIEGLIQLKKATAQANLAKGVLETDIANAIIEACDELLTMNLRDHFPLAIWQTGSGTQTNMNANEVIANVANRRHEGLQVHPNDHVNKGQSSNDVFPTAMHLMAVRLIEEDLVPAICQMREVLSTLAINNQDVMKTARTHLQDATPMTFGQEVSAWVEMMETGLEQLDDALEGLRTLAIGGTAVGTGLNSYEGFGNDVCHYLNDNLEASFQATENPFHAMSSKDVMVFMHGALSAIASNCMKIANDVRWLASGPRCGLGELKLPANEAGSSIMPGKVNPTQAEALTMVCVQVMANQQAVTIANSQGNFQLNVFMPLIVQNVWQSIRLLSDALNSFTQRCLVGLEINEEQMQHNLEISLMTATYLNKQFGYDQTARIVKKAHQEGRSIKEVVVAEGLMSDGEFDEFFRYEEMIHPYSASN